MTSYVLESLCEVFETYKPLLGDEATLDQFKTEFKV